MINKINIQHCIKVLKIEYENNWKEKSGEDRKDFLFLCQAIGSLNNLKNILEKDGRINKTN